MKEREITALEQALGYHFHRRAVIEQALTHSSQAREQEAQHAGDSKLKVSDNEQLEFLGDTVLSLVTSEDLYHRFPHFREGELSKLRAHLVSERHLIRVAQRLELRPGPGRPTPAGWRRDARAPAGPAGPGPPPDAGQHARGPGPFRGARLDAARKARSPGR